MTAGRDDRAADQRGDKRIVCLWLPRLGAERLRRRDRAAETGAETPPFATLLETRSALRLDSLDAAAAAAGLAPGMTQADARALRPDLQTAPADPTAEALFLDRLARWAGRYAPHVGLDDRDGLALDVTGAAHLFGGEAALLDALGQRIRAIGLTVRIGAADTKGAARALARFAARAGRPAVAAPGAAAIRLAPLPPAALRLDASVVDGLARLGVTDIAGLAALPRGALSRRFGAQTVRRLDQAFGAEAEPIAPRRPDPVFATRLSLPEPIGSRTDVLAAIDRLLERLIARLDDAGQGARRVVVTLRRVDRREIQTGATLARPSRDARMIRTLLDSALDGLDLGFGVDAVRLEAVQAEPIVERQLAADGPEAERRVDDDRTAELLSRLGGRLGFERLTRLAPGAAHLPDRAVIARPASHADPPSGWADAAARRPPRPLTALPPEPVASLAPSAEPPPPGAPRPPARFRWRRRVWRLLEAAGPERIAPKWWLDDPDWREGVRDYWRIEAIEAVAGSADAEAEEDGAEIARLWLFCLPERTANAGSPNGAPPWRVAGIFP